jgi:hypothetical protein
VRSCVYGFKHDKMYITIQGGTDLFLSKRSEPGYGRGTHYCPCPAHGLTVCEVGYIPIKEQRLSISLIMKLDLRSGIKQPITIGG